MTLPPTSTPCFRTLASNHSMFISATVGVPRWLHRVEINARPLRVGGRGRCLRLLRAGGARFRGGRRPRYERVDPFDRPLFIHLHEPDASGSAQSRQRWPSSSDWGSAEPDTAGATELIAKNLTDPATQALTPCDKLPAMNNPALRDTCPFCASTLTNFSRNLGGGPWFDCPACGRYGVAEYLYLGADGLNLTKEETSKVRHLLCERRLKKLPAVFLTNRTASEGETNLTTVSDFLSDYPRTPLEYYDRALMNLGRLVHHPEGNGQLREEEWGCLFGDKGEAFNLFRTLVGLGYVTDTPDLFSITPRGWTRIQELHHPGKDSRQAFVAMSFAPNLRDNFERGIKPAIEADGTRAMRIDGKEHNNHIDDEIIAEIRRSRYLVADFTEHRPGVYFEAGFALGMGIPVIWCCAKDQIKDAHFDTRQYNHITYESPEDLRVRLLNRIRATAV